MFSNKKYCDVSITEQSLSRRVSIRNVDEPTRGVDEHEMLGSAFGENSRGSVRRSANIAFFDKLFVANR